MATMERAISFFEIGNFTNKIRDFKIKLDKISPEPQNNLIAQEIKRNADKIFYAESVSFVLSDFSENFSDKDLDELIDFYSNPFIDHSSGDFYSTSLGKRYLKSVSKFETEFRNIRRIIMNQEKIKLETIIKIQEI